MEKPKINSYISSLCKNLFRAISDHHTAPANIPINLTEEKFVGTDLSQQQIVKLFLQFVQRLQPITKIVIIDQYIFAGKPTSGYKEFLVSILEPYLSTLKELCFITNKLDGKLALDVINEIRNRSQISKISIKHSKLFHDRFWIFNDKFTLSVGTSVNGLGKKLSIIQEVSDEDLEQLIAQLNKLNTET